MTPCQGFCKDELGDGLPWLGPEAKTPPSNVGGAGSTPGQEAKILQALWPKNQNVKQKQYGNKFNKDFKKINKSKLLMGKKKTQIRKVTEMPDMGLETKEHSVYTPPYLSTTAPRSDGVAFYYYQHRYHCYDCVYH